VFDGLGVVGASEAVGVQVGGSVGVGVPFGVGVTITVRGDPCAPNGLRTKMSA
jgi:hypothetical protein